MTDELPPPPRASPKPPDAGPDIKTDPGWLQNPLVRQAVHQADKAAKKRQRRTVAWSTVAFTALTLLGPDLRDALRAVVALLWRKAGGP